MYVQSHVQADHGDVHRDGISRHIVDKTIDFQLVHRRFDDRRRILLIFDQLRNRGRSLNFGQGFARDLIGAKQQLVLNRGDDDDEEGVGPKNSTYITGTPIQDQGQGRLNFNHQIKCCFPFGIEFDVLTDLPRDFVHSLPQTHDDDASVERRMPTHVHVGQQSKKRTKTIEEIFS